MKKRKIIIPTVLALLALIIVLALILSRCDTQPEETLYGSTSSTVSTGSVPSSTGENTPGSSVPATTVPSSIPASSTSAGSRPTQSTTAPTQQSTQATTKPTQAATQSTTSPAAPSCAHNFSQWEYEEYTYKQADPFDGSLHDRVSHRKVRSCTKCGYKEYGHTPDHPCQRGSANHAVTTIQEGNCLVMTIKRSTCKVCGWYIDYETKKGSHEWIDRDVHLSDYGPYTNELDATVSECTACGEKSVVYRKGEGWNDSNRYYVSFSVNSGAAYMAQPATDNFAAYDHPTWQMVDRDFVYDSDGYVTQFTLYWWYNGNRYSQIIKCGKGEIEAWFAEYNMPDDGAYNYRYQLQVCGTYVEPYKRTWTSQSG